MSRVTTELALEWKRQYEEEGKTIEDIASSTELSYSTVKRWLKKVGTKMRDSTSKRKGGHQKLVDGIKGKSRKSEYRPRLQSKYKN